MLRGGPLAQKQIIQLVNRRFVTFYFNTFRGGVGHDSDAAAWIAKVDSRFSGPAVPTPPVWIFSPDGELLETLDNYLPADRFYQELRSFLADYPEYDQRTPEEEAIISAAESGSQSDAKLRAGLLLEELGKLDEADKQFSSILDQDQETLEAASARLALARLARYSREWNEARAHLDRLEEFGPDLDDRFDEDLAMETAYGLIAHKAYDQALERLTETMKDVPDSKRTGEMRYWAGVCHFFLEAKDWANFHWCWVIRHMPDDYNVMRCTLAATADAMIYPNPDLGGYRSKQGFITTNAVDAALARAMMDYERLVDAWNDE